MQTLFIYADFDWLLLKKTAEGSCAGCVTSAEIIREYNINKVSTRDFLKWTHINNTQPEDTTKTASPNNKGVSAKHTTTNIPSITKPSSSDPAKHNVGSGKPQNIRLSLINRFFLV